MDDLAQVEELYIQSDTACASMDEFYEVRSVWFGTDTKIRGPITELSDLSHMPNLKIAYIEAEQIADLSPMKELDELQRIDLACNNISDLSPLEGKETLLEVDFLDNGTLEGIEAVRTWKAIRSLSLENTGS